jgi:hypothetical protein|tara:strand:+ start:969 stop:1757 length:789 start_codon:yes stop_codon:yes gene_type:complete
MLPLEIYPVKPPPMHTTIDHHPDYFDLNAGATIIHVGKSKSGKGQIQQNELFNPAFDLANKLDVIHIYSPTAASGDPTWRFAVEQIGDTIYSDYSDKHLKTILSAQMAIPKRQRPNIAIIFDDIATFPNINKNSLMFTLSSQARHYNIKYLKYIVQQYKMLPPVVRANTDYALISRTTNEKEIADMEFEMGSKYDNKFRKLLAQATNEPYSFLYLRLNDVPSTAFQRFTKKIYTATMLGDLQVQLSLGDKKKTDEDEDLKPH